MNDAPPSTTTYVSRVLALPPGVARQVFDLCRVDRQHRSPDPDRWSVAAADALLRVDGPGHVTPGSTLLRSCRGTLRIGRWSPTVAVELELCAWSPTRSEVALRLLGRRRPRAGYLDAATACVDAFTRSSSSEDSSPCTRRTPRGPSGRSPGLLGCSGS